MHLLCGQMLCVGATVSHVVDNIMLSVMPSLCLCLFVTVRSTAETVKLVGSKWGCSLFVRGHAIVRSPSACDVIAWHHI